MSSRIATLVLLIVLFATALCAYWLGFGNQNLQSGIFLFTSLTAVAGGVYGMMSYGFSGGRSKTVLLLTVGVFCFFVGEALWNYYEALGVSTFPSLADVFYLSAYPFIFAGLVNEIILAQIVWKNFSRALLFLLSFATILLVSIVLYFGVFLAYHSGEPMLNNIIAMGYGVADVILIVVTMLILVLVWEFRGGKLSQTWICIFIGLISMLIADVLFAVYTGQYEARVMFYKSLIDTFFMLSYLLLSFGLFNFGFSLEEVTETIGQKKKLKVKS